MSQQVNEWIHRHAGVRAGSQVTSPSKKVDSRTVKNGSEALTVCVKDTATVPRLMLVNTVPNMCPAASGAILANCGDETRTKVSIWGASSEEGNEKIAFFSVARISSPVQGRVWARGGAWSPT